MAGLIRMVLLGFVAYVVYAGARAFLRSRGRLPGGRRPEIEMPFCLRCESSRNVVVNSGEGAGDTRWYCTKCHEHF